MESQIARSSRTRNVARWPHTGYRTTEVDTNLGLLYVLLGVYLCTNITAAITNRIHAVGPIIIAPHAWQMP